MSAKYHGSLQVLFLKFQTDISLSIVSSLDSDQAVHDVELTLYILELFL